MSEAKSTSEIRMIAEGAIHSQAALCDARRDNLELQLSALARAVGANASTVEANASAVATLTTNIATLTVLVQAQETARKAQETEIRLHSAAIEKLKGPPAVWAALGAALPTLLGVLLWFFSR